MVENFWLKVEKNSYRGQRIYENSSYKFSSFDKAKKILLFEEYQAAHGLLKDTVMKSSNY